MLFVIVFGLLVIGELANGQGYLKANVDEILNNERILKSYVDCLLDRGNCSPEAEELKHDIPELLENGCEHCTEEHKAIAKKVCQHFLDKRRNWWDELEAKYDPDGTFKIKYAEILDREGIQF